MYLCKQIVFMGTWNRQTKVNVHELMKWCYSIVTMKEQVSKFWRCDNCLCQRWFQPLVFQTISWKIVLLKNEAFFYPLCHMQRSLLRSEVIDVTTLKSSLIKFMAIFYEYDGVQKCGYFGYFSKNEVNLANWATFDALMVWLLFFRSYLIC